MCDLGGCLSIRLQGKAMHTRSVTEHPTLGSSAYSHLQPRTRQDSFWLLDRCITPSKIVLCRKQDPQGQSALAASTMGGLHLDT